MAAVYDCVSSASGFGSVSSPVLASYTFLCVLLLVGRSGRMVVVGTACSNGNLLGVSVGGEDWSFCIGVVGGVMEGFLFPTLSSVTVVDLVSGFWMVGDSSWVFVCTGRMGNGLTDNGLAGEAGGRACTAGCVVFLCLSKARAI